MDWTAREMDKDWHARAVRAEAENLRLRDRITELEAELDLLASTQVVASSSHQPLTTTSSTLDEPLCAHIPELRLEGTATILQDTPSLSIGAACDGANCVAISLLTPSTFVVAGANGLIVSYSGDQATHRTTLPSPAIALRKSSDKIAAATMDGALYLLSPSLETHTRHKHHDKFVVDCDWSPNGQFLATCARDKCVVLYSNNIKDRSFVLPNNPECCRFLDDSTLIVACRDEPFLRYVDLASAKESRVSLNANSWDTHVSFDVLHLAVSLDAKYIAVATSTHRHVVYSARDNAQVRVLTGHTSDNFANTRLAWLGAENESLVSSSSDSSILQWDFASGKQIAKIDQAHAQPVRNLDSLQADNVLATASFDKAAKLWRTAAI